MSELHQAVAQALGEFWEATVIPSGSSAGGVCQPLDSELDSISSCDVLEQLERIVGFELEPERVIRRGGYTNRDQFISELGKAVMEQAREKRK